MEPTLTTTEREALVQFKNALSTLLGGNLVSVRLFGSRARGEGTSDRGAASAPDGVLVNRKSRTRSSVFPGHPGAVGGKAHLL